MKDIDIYRKDIRTIVVDLRVLKESVDEMRRTRQRRGIRVELATHLLAKLIAISEEFLSRETELMHKASLLRYTLESLILLILFREEPRTLYSVYYSIYDEQINKVEWCLARLRAEIELMGELEKIENEKLAEVHGELDKLAESGDPGAIQKQINRVHAEVEEMVGRKITVYLGAIESKSHSFGKFYLQEELQPQYAKQLEHVRKVKNSKAADLLQTPEFKNLFPGCTEPSQVYEQLKEKRSWIEKARATGLGDEYAFVRDYTSALIHCTSYSFFSRPGLMDDEAALMLRLQVQYLRRCINNIKKLCEY